MLHTYKDRLFPMLDKIASHYGTPFHIYDEAGIRETGNSLKKAFAGIDRFREYYAVKALPNPRILSIMKDMGFGFDCSSIPELLLGRQVGGRGEEIMFTSNNTSELEFIEAEKNGGCILNLDDLNLLAKVPNVPELICFRYNPGAKRTGNDIIGKPTEAKYGVSEKQIIEAYRQAKSMGVARFGIHTMLASNELNYQYMVQTSLMLLELIAEISAKLDITFEFINIGGGLGIPYQPGVAGLDLQAMGRDITKLFKEFRQQHGYEPALYMESGRFMTGPHGVLVTRAINRKEIYRTYVGVDASMSSLCVQLCTVPTIILKCSAKMTVPRMKSLMWSVPFAKTTTSLPFSANFRKSMTATFWSSTTQVHTEVPWASTITAISVPRNYCSVQTETLNLFGGQSGWKITLPPLLSNRICSSRKCLLTSIR